MLLARIRGTLVSTQKEQTLDGLAFFVCEQLDLEGKPLGKYVVAADAVGAGVGEVVLYASGSCGRYTSVTHNRPCDCVIMAIVDELEVDGRTVYRKSADDRG
ncbi:MAG TPA: EutN/CcmL family microcompartment protein [bacterium]|nr:EutN/CcmL family microcompartment protein [bacterium]HPJ71817.1 EutN/CcmL family microcompartment protein [bacterium]HPQ67040.1 EutN/CcmL family microcompartment protein [bacterium]